MRSTPKLWSSRVPVCGRRTGASAVVAGLLASAFLSSCLLANNPEGVEVPEERLIASEIYARVSPSVAFVETPLGSGTGVLLDDDLLLTNAHVLWPFDEARVVFADATEIVAAPVVARDLLADVALIDLSDSGGAPRGANPATIGSGVELPVGEDVYLVGYPAEVEPYPLPAITRGILSRKRHWESADMPFLQTDSAIAGGQSGGALVAPDGTVVGITSMIFGEGEFGLALSAPEAVERVMAELASDVDGTAPRRLPDAEGRRSIESAIDGTWNEAVYLLDGAYGQDVDLSVTSSADAALVALSPYGDLDLDVDETKRGREAGSVRLLEMGPYFVVVTLDQPGDFSLASSYPLVELDDPDDGAAIGSGIGSGSTFVGQMDFPGDIDYLMLDLGPGDRVAVTVDTVSFTPDVVVYRADDTAMSSPAAEGLIGGALGMTAAATVTSDEGGRYVVLVRDYDDLGTGAYRVTVD